MDLSTKAQQLIEACVANNEMLIVARTFGGTTIQIGDITISHESMREQAEVEDAIAELVRKGYLEDRAGRDNIFFPTPRAPGVNVDEADVERIASEIIQAAVELETSIQLEQYRAPGLRVSVGDKKWGVDAATTMHTEIACGLLLARGYVVREGDDFLRPTHRAFTAGREQHG